MREKKIPGTWRYFQVRVFLINITVLHFKYRVINLGSKYHQPNNVIDHLD